MRDSVTVTISIPDRCLSPNASGGNSRRGQANFRNRRRFQKQEAWLNTCNAQHPDGPRDWPKALVKVYWYGRTRSVLKMDQDNAIASLKGAGDGLEMAGLIANDRGIEWDRPVEFAVDKANPRVELVVTRADAAAKTEAGA